MKYRMNHRTLDDKDFTALTGIQRRPVSESRAKNGNFIANTTKYITITAPTRVNKKIELELTSFKQEIENKFASASTKDYVYK